MSLKVLLFAKMDPLAGMFGLGYVIRAIVKWLPSHGVEVTFNIHDKYDLIYAHDGISYEAVRISRRYKKPLISHFHVLYPYVRNKHKQESLLLEASDQVIFVSYLLKNLAEVYYSLKSDWHVVHNGVDTSVFFPDKPDGEVDADLIYIGRIAELRKCFRLLEIIAEREGIRFLAVGEKPPFKTSSAKFIGKT